AGAVAEALAPYVAGVSDSMVRIRQTMRFHAGQLTMHPPALRRRLLGWTAAALAGVCLVALTALAWLNVFPGGSHQQPDDSRTRSTGSDSNTPLPTDTKVITIENGLTVAKDGTAQFTTIKEALAEIKPGQTIRVLDKAVYTEEVQIDKAARMKGLTLESPEGATILIPPGKRKGIFVMNVPQVAVRGFRLGTNNQDRNWLCLVAGKSPGATFEALDLRLEGSVCIGLSMEELNLLKGDAPVTVRNCKFAGFYQALRVSGQRDSGQASPSHRIVLRDNDVSDCVVGIWMGGLVSDVYVV